MTVGNYFYYCLAFLYIVNAAKKKKRCFLLHSEFLDTIIEGLWARMFRVNFWKIFTAILLFRPQKGLACPNYDWIM